MDRSGGQPDAGQSPGRLLVAAGPVKDARRQPGTGRRLHKRGVQRVPEPDPVQPVTEPAWPDQPRGTLARGDHLVQAGVLL